MHSVFDKTPQTHRRKKHVREHKNDYDAQSAHQKLNSFCTESNNASTRVSTTLNYITLFKTESCKGTSDAFILHWKDQIRVHETLVPTNSHFSEYQKRIMVKNEVDSVGTLRSIKDQSDQCSSQSGQELSYEKYSNLILLEATNYDIQFSSSGIQSSRKVDVTESNNYKFLVIPFLS